MILALIRTSVAPSEEAFAMHSVPHPLPDVFATITPLIMALSMNVILQELAIVPRPVHPTEVPRGMLAAALVLTLKFCTVRPSFHTRAVLFVFRPLALVHRAIYVVV